MIGILNAWPVRCRPPEMKFPSFPDLIQAITSDVQTAKETLDMEPYAAFGADPFLTDLEPVWTGTAGGDAEASFEFESTPDFLA